MAIENTELMHKHFPKHLPIGTTKIKEDKETEEKGKQKSVKMKKLKWASNKEVPKA